MSNEFNALRARAREKRDRLIAEVRREYESTLVDIAKLEQDLMGMRSSRYRKISAAIEAVIPGDRPFTTRDILTGLEALDSGRVWRAASVNNHLSRLREKGLVRRIKRATIKEPAVYTRVETPAKVVPLDDMTLAETVRAVLTRPMSVIEVCVAVKEADYHSTMSNANLRSHVTRVLKGGGYRQDGGKWTAAS